MSNLRDYQVPGTSVDPTRPSTSAQTLQSINSYNDLFNEKTETAGSPSEDNQQTSSFQRQREPDGANNHASLDDLTKQAQNVNIATDIQLDSSTEPRDNAGNKKCKDFRKREKKKKLNLQMPHTGIVSNVQVQNTNITQSHYVRPVQEMFVTNISPLYASTSSRYLENQCYHPQYQLMYNVQAQEIMQSRSQFLSTPNTPLIQQQPKSPQFLNNVMQHPLLCKSFPIETHNQGQQNHLTQNVCQLQQVYSYPFLISNSTTACNQEAAKLPASPDKNKKKRNRNQNKIQEPKTADDKKFEPYISEEEIAVGLKNNSLVEGVLRINPKQFQHSYVSSQDRSEQDVLIDGIKHRNRGLEGDIVIVQLLNDSEKKETDEESKQKRGKVVYIKEKVHTRTCIGNLKLMPDRNRQRALFVPRDHRIPRLNIPCTSWPDNFHLESKKYENTLFLSKILDWTDIRFAVGTLVCFIGQSGDIKTETKAILAQNDLDVTPFGPEMRDLYPRLDYTIPETEVTVREDCRKLCVFSIDPHNCRDIDDAVSCRWLENGNFEIGVHISDVASFLAEDTILDEKVANKATTIYLVEKAYHMLPDELCMLCSLFPGVDKLAFSVFWEITTDAKVLSHRFSKTIIHSCCQLSYEHAQAVLDGKKDAQDEFPEIYNGFKYEDVHTAIKTLGCIAATFRKERFEGGALRIDQPKVSFSLDANAMPEKFCINESRESHQLIEEFMLLANMTVANRIYEDHPKLSFLRCHPPPSGYMLKQLAKSLKPMGIELDISSAGNLQRSLQPFVSPDNPDKGKAMVLSMLCAKPMARAKYFCAGGCEDEDFKHYALNVPLYTHFTSPIRRYADIMVHR